MNMWSVVYSEIQKFVLTTVNKFIIPGIQVIKSGCNYSSTW